ncbi:MAG: 5-formyltetrahydrofolate cyclo-ligase [Gammaproteobacteria bacterium]|nr:5-formyltetrahydrofolate cyclo-ligase [Gammaproteobacteria bacterium]MCP5418524.1 5-formyltetrahydrofolate cyclo-ligase [Chromatiaceae bacterium]
MTVSNLIATKNGTSSANQLRHQLRERRRSLSRAEQTANAEAAAGHLIRWGIFLRYQSIALYHACDGELDPSPIIHRGFSYGKKLYLPVLRGGNKNALWFVPHHPEQRMWKNRFGIDEPDSGRNGRIAPWGLDLILLPLVGFDQLGNRLGMGGGFYDRTLAFLKWRSHWHRPTLIGMAHDCQRLQKIEAHSWDIPLDGIVSESGLQLIDKGKA